MLEIYDIQTEYRTNPLGIDEKRPAFSWKLRSEKNDTMQTGYRIVVSPKDAGIWNRVWDSEWIESDQSVYLVYAGKELKPRTEYLIDIYVRDNYGRTASAETGFETGLMDAGQISADFITHGFSDEMEAPAVFARNFAAAKKVAKARAYVSALGVYCIHLNGKRVGEDRFAPGWTSYQERLQYQTYDITGYLEKENRVEITVGNGWYKGILGFYNQGCHYGKRTAVIAEIELTYEDGSRDVIKTDESWKSTTGPIRYSEIYHGEVIDHNLPKQEEVPAVVYDYPKKNLTAQESEPVRITQRVEAREVIHSPAGETIIDFGQNLTGVVEARLYCEAGTKVVLRHAEALDENGNLFTANLRTARATDTFITGGAPVEVFLPEFTFHGFRYVAVEGLEEVNKEDFTACVIHTDFARGGQFFCDNAAVDQLARNIDWTMRSNYLDVPMDCPQRDERLGYTGDAEIFLPTALFHGNLALFYRKWLRDLRVEQTEEFGVPLTVPDILRTHACVSIWHDAATIVPWLIWQTYGDLRVLKEQYESMKESVEYTRRQAGEEGLLTVSNSSQFGDWVALDAPKGPFRPTGKGEVLHPSMDEKGGGTDSHLIGNVYYLYSIDILAKTAEVLGKDGDALKYRQLYEDVKSRFQDEYITRNGRLVSQTQTAAALVLYFDLAPEKDRKKILDQLVLQLVKTGKHLHTGFVGTEYLPHVLSEYGLHQFAGDILQKDDCPSWLYAVKLDATTVWELWDGVNEDHSFNMFTMNSLNQYGFATIGDWMVKRLAGISPLAPGYRKSRIAPQLVRGIPGVEASYETPYGRLACKLTCRDGRMTADIEIPANATAEVALPGQAVKTLGSGRYHFEYETALSFEATKYSEDSTLKQLMADPDARAYFEERDPKLARDPMVLNFAGRASILEIKKTMPNTMVPTSAYPIFDEMIDMLNRKEKER